jgi:hypothetical protein
VFKAKECAPLDLFICVEQGAGRRQNLMEFVAHMPVFLDLVGVSNFRVIVVEQTQFGHWNKGVLFNRGGL